MRRSSQQPLRVRNDPDSQGRKPRLSTDKRSSSGSRLSASRSSFGSRNSFGYVKPAQSRQSTNASQPPPKRRTTVGRLYGDLRQDPRNVTERRFKEREIGHLIEFLIEHGYPHQLTHKQLQSPRSKEFVQIFEFMYSLLEPGFLIKGKIEDVFPQTMKELGYCFTISKTSMYAIGSPHTWPNLLAALSWLRESIQHTIGLNMDTIMFPATTQDEFEGVPLSKLFYTYCQYSYTKFLEGDDTFEELDQRLAKDISKNSAGGDIEGLVHENRRFKQLVESMEKQQDPMIANQDKLAGLKLDYDKIIRYNQQLENHLKQLNVTGKTVEDENKSMEAELIVSQAENKKKLKILATQQFSQDDVERINRQRQGLQQQIEATETENEHIQKLIWEEELKIGKNQDNIYKKCTAYNQKARILRLIPSSEELAQGIDYEIQPSLEEINSQYFQNTIKPALTHLRNQLMDKVNEVEEERIQLHSSREQLTDHVADKEETVSNLDDKMGKLDDKLDRLKKVQVEELTERQLEIDQYQQKLKVLHTSGSKSQSNHDLQKEIHASKLRLNEVVCMNKKSVKKMHEFMMKIVTIAIDHKATIQEHILKVQKEAELRLEEEKRLNLD